MNINTQGLIESLSSTFNKKRTAPYDTVATVTRVEEDTVWVHIPSGINETPIRKTISCRVGDNIQIRVSDGNAWVVGNATAPPTDDTVALEAKNKATEVELSARQALGMASDAYNKSVETATSFASAVVTINNDIDNLQSQIDGNITTWFYDYEPTTSNEPASDWSADEKSNHLGDLFYDTSTGYAYRWMVENNVYSWSRITDTDVTTALANASEAKDIADSKRRVFISTPTVPYDVGDLWCVGSSGDILTCTTAKTSSQSYSSSDWSKLNKYTDDSAFVAFRDGTYATFVTNTNSGLNSKITTFYQTSAPTASAKGDLWIDTDDGNKLYRWNGSTWANVQDTAIQTALTNASNAQTTADGKIMTYAQTTAPTGDLDVGDLWIDTDDSNKMYRWSGTKWVQYTDSSALNTFISGTYATDKTNLQSQIDGKAETWYQSSDPSSAWNTTALKTQHKGDLWYNTSTNTTWYWSGTSWQQQDIPTAVFDEIDGKAQIFTSQPTPPYNIGDLWFDSNTSDIMTCIVARASGSYTASDWEKRNKYTDDTSVGTLNDTVSGLNDTLNKLTGAVDIVEGSQPYIQIHTSTTTGEMNAGVKITDERLSFMQNAQTEVAYIDSSEEDGTLNINTTKTNRLIIGELEIFEFRGGIGIRRV